MRFDRDKPPLWRLALILLTGVAGTLGVFAFGRYVEQIDDTFGATPASWGFKARSQEVQRFFPKGTAMTEPSATTLSDLPVAVHGPAHTETAIFALG